MLFRSEQLRISVVANQTRNMTIKGADRITENDEIIIYGSFKLEVQQGKADWQLASDLPEADMGYIVPKYALKPLETGLCARTQ